MKGRARAAIVSGAVVLAGWGAIVGSNGAQAGFPCSENAFLTQDIWVEVGDEVYAGIDYFVNSGDPTNGPHHLWACVAPVGGEPNQTWLFVGTHDPAGGGEGLILRAMSNNCTVSLSSEPAGPCNYVLAPTGAEVTPPVVTVDPPIIDGNGTTGVTAAGGGACLYVNSSTPTCQPVP